MCIKIRIHIVKTQPVLYVGLYCIAFFSHICPTTVSPPIGPLETIVVASHCQVAVQSGVNDVTWIHEAFRRPTDCKEFEPGYCTTNDTTVRGQVHQSQSLYCEVAKLRCSNIALATVCSCADSYYKCIVTISARVHSSQPYIATTQFCDVTIQRLRLVHLAPDALSIAPFPLPEGPVITLLFAINIANAYTEQKGKTHIT